jgi:hypothetical protein
MGIRIVSKYSLDYLFLFMAIQTDGVAVEVQTMRNGFISSINRTETTQTDGGAMMILTVVIAPVWVSVVVIIDCVETMPLMPSLRPRTLTIEYFWGNKK